MSGAPAAVIAARLIEAGRAGSTPALVVENASLATERRIVTTLATLGDATDGLEGPALLVIGEVAAMAHALEPTASIPDVSGERGIA